MSRRPALAAGLFAGLMAVFCLLLWNLQIVHGAEYAEAAQRSFVETEPVPAARGRLLDRKGRVLAEDRAVWTARVSDRTDEETVARWAETDFKTFDEESQLLFDGDKLLLIVY